MLFEGFNNYIMKIFNCLNSILICLLFTSIGVAQEKITLHIKYEFLHSRNAEQVDVISKENVVLSVSDKSSRYCSERRYNEVMQIAEKKSTGNAGQNSGSAKVVSGGPLLLVNNSGPLMKEEIIKKFEDEKLFIYTSLGFKSFQIETPIPEIKWEIKPESRNIGNIKCQKAIGDYAGRTYIAWFAPELPYNDGPWKLSGLPGLILEASDDKNEVQFKFKELIRSSEKRKESLVSFNKSRYNQPISLKSYNRLKNAFESDPVGVSRAQVNNARVLISNVNGDSNKDAANLKIKKYNPIELE